MVNVAIHHNMKFKKTLSLSISKDKVCLGLMSHLNISGHIATVPACSSGNLTYVLPHRNAMPQTEHDTPPYHSIQTCNCAIH